MAWINFNGIDSRKLGCIIEVMPTENRGGRRIIESEPIGRHSSVKFDERSFLDYSTSITLNCFGQCRPRDIYAWLNGSGWLITSDEPDRKRWVSFFGEQSNSRWRSHSIYDSITIPMVCDPFAYESTTRLVGVTKGSTLYNPGDIESDPILYITPTGKYKFTLTVGDKPFEIDLTNAIELPSQVVIDCDGRIGYIIKSDGSSDNAYLNKTIIDPKSESTNRWYTFPAGVATKVDWSPAYIRKLEIDPQWRWF